MDKFVSLFKRSNSVIIGMLHIRALPGSPNYGGCMKKVIDTALEEAEIFKNAGVDGLILENMHDVPWLGPHQLGPETTAAMAVTGAAVRKLVPSLPLGVQVLSACNREALAVAKAAELDFIRAEGYVFSHIGDEGPVNSCAADLLRYRRHIDAEHIHVYTDIKKKHSSHSITSDVSIEETAKAAEMFQSDGIIVTGTATGQPTDIKEMTSVQASTSLPVMVGSGVTVENLNEYIAAHGIIIGSHMKAHGLYHEAVDPIRVGHFMAKVGKVRQEQERAEETPTWTQDQVD